MVDAVNQLQNDSFLLTPLREGRRAVTDIPVASQAEFLLTPLREGRHAKMHMYVSDDAISTHAPAGGATQSSRRCIFMKGIFLLTPLREGRQQFSTSPS